MNHFTVATLPLSTALNLHETFFCGQAFRWHALALSTNTAYYAALDGTLVLLYAQSSTLTVYASAPVLQHRPLAEFMHHYLGLTDRLEEVFSPLFRQKYPHLVQGAAPYFGLRLLRQPAFETLISFMCAQGIGIALIRRQVAALARTFGSPLSLSISLSPSGQLTPHFSFAITEYTFPTPECLAEASLSQLQRCTNFHRARAERIRRIARAVADGSLNLAALTAPHATFEHARETLLQYDGIGEKIADCICLFGLGHHEAFPIDTHVRQYLAEWFGLKAPTTSLTPRAYRELAQAARDILGTKYAGLAGQWLFHHWRRDIRKMRDY
ncbi:MAG: DNA glycosylase [Chloroherpetonaceae bacterium]|nr:Fe-S cluster assembly protein HesB [Chloroherpetonaceae bacterium]MCS7212150.1 Fe-S cluster assembly protein HesB [Chloroherpetonaceae bacterium]MDW8019605.1 DNA glycosylase [Chloroherpetonaceae bacterium]